MKVLVVSKSYVEPEKRKNIIELARRADVRVVSPEALSHRLDPYEHRLDTSDVVRSRYLAFPAWRVFGSEYLLRSVSLGIRAFKPDVIHVEHEPWSVQFRQSLLARRMSGSSAPIVCGIKKNTYRRYPGIRGRMKYVWARSAVRAAAHFMASSRMVIQLHHHLFGTPLERASLVPQWGVDTTLFRPRARREEGRSWVVGYVGRLVPEKGIEDLVRACEHINADRRAAVELRIVGDGVLRDRLEKVAVDRAWLTVGPPLPNRKVAAFLADLDVFVMPTRVMPDHQEHDGHAVLEALASGVPTVGARSGVIPEILGDGVGLVVEPASPLGLADAILNLRRNPALKDQLASRGKALVHGDYTVQRIADKKLEVYSKVLDDS